MQVHLFDNESALREVIGKIVVPNLQIRETDEERFEDDPADFIMEKVAEVACRSVKGWKASARSVSSVKIFRNYLRRTY